LEEFVHVADSSIHGKGCFAACDIKKGTLIGIFQGRRTTIPGMHTLLAMDDKNRVVGRIGSNDLRYLNSASRANAAFEGFRLYARRNIPKGDELTINYNTPIFLPSA